MPVPGRGMMELLLATCLPVGPVLVGPVLLPVSALLVVPPHPPVPRAAPPHVVVQPVHLVRHRTLCHFSPPPLFFCAISGLYVIFTLSGDHRLPLTASAYCPGLSPENATSY